MATIVIGFLAAWAVGSAATDVARDIRVESSLAAHSVKAWARRRVNLVKAAIDKTVLTRRGRALRRLKRGRA
jgi:hypothetical protein